MIRHLELCRNSIWRPIAFPNRLITASFPNLVSLTSSRTLGTGQSDPLAMNFLKYRGAYLCQLDLDLSMSSLELDQLKKVKFTKLLRLRVAQRVGVDIVEHILKRAPDLVALCYLNHCTSNYNSRTEATMLQIEGVLKEKRNLTDLYVVTQDSKQVDAVCQAIELGLQSTRKWNRKLLKIGIEFDMEMKIEQILVFLSRILNGLLLCDIDEFAVFLHDRSMRLPLCICLCGERDVSGLSGAQDIR